MQALWSQNRDTEILHCVKALVRWATGERLTNRLPKVSLITLSPPLDSGILGLRMGPYVPTPKFVYNIWGPRESDFSDSSMWKVYLCHRSDTVMLRSVGPSQNMKKQKNSKTVKGRRQYNTPSITHCLACLECNSAEWNNHNRPTLAQHRDITIIFFLFFIPFIIFALLSPSPYSSL